MSRNYGSDFSKGYMITGTKGTLVDIVTGEVYFDVLGASQEDLRRIRNKVAWQDSLDNDSDLYGENVALDNLLSIFHICYWEYPDFIPGFALRRWRENERHGW